jgi:hypothetical protein
MKLFVRVSRPAHVRVLYNLADGRRVLLYDDLYLDSSQVLRAVEIPEDFECAAPFGSETIVVLARTSPFPPLKARLKDGYKVLQARSASEAALQLRGMKLKSASSRKIDHAQETLTLTTVPKTGRRRRGRPAQSESR